MRLNWHITLTLIRQCCWISILLMFSGVLKAQPPVNNKCVFKDGKIYITMGKHTPEALLDSFINRFNLSDMPIKSFISSNKSDSLERMGWKFIVNTPEIFVMSKALAGADNLNDPEEKILFAEKPVNTADRFPAENNGTRFGYNRFRNKMSFATTDSLVTFFLRNNKKATKVILSGSFSDWSTDAIPMQAVDSGWIATVKLGPGKFWYKFIIDGNWTTDSDNQVNENDGEGNVNSVFYRPNHVFKLDGMQDAKKVVLTGSFNDWQPKGLPMVKTSTGWELPLYLPEGTHTYRFVVDGKWMVDPGNPDKLPNEFNDFNSLVRVGKTHLFKLDGHLDAKTVMLTGSFNNWHQYELPMTKTSTGWELPYVLGKGNYEYHFLVDGKQVADPANPLLTGTEGAGNRNSFLIIGANHTFRLKGYADASKVFLAGDFNKWAPNALLMTREGDEWVFRVYLSAGKHLYKFCVDNNWIIDPGNKLWEQNEYGTGNSVYWMENSDVKRSQ